MKNLLYALSEGIGICLVAGALIGGCNLFRLSVYNEKISRGLEQLTNSRSDYNAVITLSAEDSKKYILETNNQLNNLWIK